MICLFISGLFCLPSKAQQPGENVSSQTIRKLGEKHFFSISTIPDDIFRLMQGKTYKKNCTVARSELRYIRCLHVDKNGRNIVGEMVVNKAIATDVLDILKKLFTPETAEIALCMSWKFRSAAQIFAKLPENLSSRIGSEEKLTAILNTMASGKARMKLPSDRSSVTGRPPHFSVGMGESGPPPPSSQMAPPTPATQPPTSQRPQKRGTVDSARSPIRSALAA